MAGEVIVDALPYIDQGYDNPGVREAVSYFFHREIRISKCQIFAILKSDPVAFFADTKLETLTLY